MLNPTRRRRPAIVHPLEPRRLLSGLTVTSVPTLSSGGTLLLSGTNSYAGGIAVSGGTLQAGGGTVSPTPTPTPTVGTLTGRVYDDAAERGYDSGVPAAGVTVSLADYNTGAVEATATTDAGGVYTFADVAPAAYTVTPVVPAGEGLTEPFLGRYTQGVAAGVTYDDLDFGLAPAGAVAGTVFDDANVNGVADPGEAGVPGIVVTAAPQGVGGYRPVAQAVTDAAGHYSFPALPVGDYLVTADATNAGGFITVPFRAGEPVTATAGGLATAAPIGEASDQAGLAVFGVVFSDANGNGVDDDPDEYWSSDPTVYLDLNGNGQQDPTEPTATTDDRGNYTFYDLPAGTYTVRPVVASGSGDFGQTTLPPDTVTTGVGLATPIGLGPVPLAGTVRHADGTPVAGATLYLDAAEGPSTVTAADGTYRFDDLPAGTYTVRQATPLGYTVATPGGADDCTAAVGEDGPAVGNDFTDVPLPAGPLSATILTRPTRAATAGSRGTVRVRLTDAERTPFAGAVPVSVYVSDDGQVTRQDVAAGGVTRSVRLAGGRSAVVAVPVTYPADMVGGDYHLVAAATTAAADAPALASVAVTADLSPAIVAPAAGVTVRPGVPTAIVVRLANRGTVAAVGSATVVVSAVATDGSAVATVGSTTATRLRVAAGRSASVRVIVTPPAGLAAGSYRLVAVVGAVTSPADDDPTDDESAAVPTRGLRSRGS